MGDTAYPMLLGSDNVGRVVQVFPAIGMVDLQWPNGVVRFPVEELQRLVVNDSGAVFPDPPNPVNEDVPAGAGVVPVSGGPIEHLPEKLEESQPPSTLPEAESPKRTNLDDMARKNASAVSRLAETYVKQALYWASKDRHYQATRGELESNSYTCPKCKDACLKPASYKRAEGASEKLLACPNCLFLIKRCDIIGHPEYIDDSQGMI